MDGYEAGRQSVLRELALKFPGFIFDDVDVNGADLIEHLRILMFGDKDETQ